MNKDEINRYIHVEIMGKCWHDLVLGNDDVWRCNEIDCKLEVRNYGGIHGEPNGNPDYCSDDSPRWLLEDVVAKIDEQILGLSLFKQAFGYAFTSGRFDGSITVVGAMKYTKATAEQIATACVLAHKEQK